MICLYKERDIFKNGFTNVLNFAFTNVVYLVRKLDVVANVKETLHYYENKRINDNINFSFIWISKL